MSVDQFEVCEIVVEGFAIELTDVGVATLVIGVALVAWQRCCAALSAMKSMLSRSIGGDLLVTIQAQPGSRIS